MVEYIIRELAIKEIAKCIVHQDTRDADLHNIGLREAMSAIDRLLPADVVEVVRCRDCRHYNDKLELYADTVCTIRHYCDGSPLIVLGYEYCSSGKRREEAADHGP